MAVGETKYWRSDLISKHVRDVPEFAGVEALMVKFKVGRSWLMVTGVYKPPSLKFSKWKEELYKLLEHATSACEDILVLGDLNCDILRPFDNGGEHGHLLDMCDIFSLNCLISEPTRLTTTSQTLIDVLLTNKRRRFLTSGTLEPHISGQRLIYTVKRSSDRHKKSLMDNNCQKLQDYDKEKFLSDLAAVPFHVPFIFDDVGDLIWAFEKLMRQ